MTVCHICFKVFSSQQMLDYHLTHKKTPCQPPKELLPCEYCDKSYSRLDSLSRHLTTCSKNPNKLTKTYECPKCSSTSSRREYLHRHMSSRCMKCIGMKMSDVNDIIANIKPKMVDNSTNTTNTDNSTNDSYNTNNIDMSNNTNNNTTNNNVKNITNITLPGKERLDHITDEFMETLPKDDVIGSCEMYTEKLLFDKDAYENHKFWVSNINRQDGVIEYDPVKRLLTRENTKDVTSKYTDISLRHICRRYAKRRMDKKISKEEDDFYEHATNIYIDEDPNYSQDRRRLIERIKLSAYNYKRIPRDTFDEFIHNGVINPI